jgi:uncharacterized membrane protein
MAGSAGGEPMGPSRAEDTSVGELISEIGQDLSKMVRQEMELAKAEVKEDATKAGKAAGMLGGAGFAGVMVAVFASLAVVLGLANVMDAGWAALIVAAAWAVVAGVLFALGRRRMQQVSPKPERTIETMKENAQWAKHPTR